VFDFSTKADRKEAAVFLDTVWQGLEYLCQQVEQEERKRVAKHGKNFAYTDFGSQPGDAMICNYFLWYASALYNFIGVFQKAFSVSEDLEHNEFANVITWRKKVAAHTSWVWPRGDNAATQDMSIMLYPEFNFRLDGHFDVGGAQSGRATGQLIMPSISLPTQGSGVTEVASFIEEVSYSPDWQWGLVCTHERLMEIVSKYAVAK
jgi:hypothetical protein